MAGIYIKGMNKPTNCFLCHLSYMRGERLFCYLTNEEVIRAKIASECPLISVSDHGRLIDADAIPRFGGRKGLIHSADVDAMPTIIPASRKESQ